jgi:hypothetical protein
MDSIAIDSEGRTTRFWWDLCPRLLTAAWSSYSESWLSSETEELLLVLLTDLISCQQEKKQSLVNGNREYLLIAKSNVIDPSGDTSGLQFVNDCLERGYHPVCLNVQNRALMRCVGGVAKGGGIAKPCTSLNDSK